MKEKTEILKAMDALQIYGGNSPTNPNVTQNNCPSYNQCLGCYQDNCGLTKIFWTCPKS